MPAHQHKPRWIYNPPVLRDKNRAQDKIPPHTAESTITRALPRLGSIYQERNVTDRVDESLRKYRAGREMMARGNHAGAVKSFEESSRAFPHFKTLELLGECQLALGNPSAALVPLAAAVGLGANAFRALYLLAQAFADLGEKKAALKYVKRALAIKADFKDAMRLKQSLMAG